MLRVIFLLFELFALLFFFHWIRSTIVTMIIFNAPRVSEDGIVWVICSWAQRVLIAEVKQPPDLTHTVLPYSPHSACEKPPLHGASVTDAESAIYAECQLQSSSDETGSTVGRGAAVIKLHKTGAVSNGTACSSASSYLLYKQGNDTSSNIVVASLSDSRSPVRGQGHVTMAISGDRRVSGSDAKTLDDGRGGIQCDYNSIRRVLTMAGGSIGASVESDALAWASVTHAGTVITLPRSGSSVTI